MWSDKETDKDFLGYGIHASMIKDVITEPQNLPMTVGLYGDWGSGKSSVLNLLKKQIEEDTQLKETTSVIYFDGWAFESFDDAKMSLIDGIVTKLSKSKQWDNAVKEKVEGLFGKLKKTIFSMRSLFWGIKNLTPHIGMAIATHGVSIIPSALELLKENKDKAQQFLEKSMEELNQDKVYEAVHQFRDDFEELVEATGLDQVVILIDDLDRCLPRHIIDSLEAIKLFLDVSKVAFVIAADENIVSSAIKSELPKLGNSNDKATVDNLGKMYMEKFIQLPYKLPKLSDAEVISYITLLFCQSLLDEDSFEVVYESFKVYLDTKKNRAFDTNAIPSGIRKDLYDKTIRTTAFVAQFAEILSKGLRRNPRLIKRFLNAYELRCKLLAKNDITDSESKYALLKLMLLEMLSEEAFIQLHGFVMNNDSVCPEIIDIEKYALSNEGKLPGQEWESGDILSIIRTEPYFSSVNLKELYWVSRDKLVNGMNSNALIPQWIKDVVTAITQEEITTAQIDLKWTEFSSNASSQNVSDFISEIERKLIVHPENNSIHLVYIHLALTDNQFLTSYLKICKRIDFPNLLLFSLGSYYSNLLEQNPNEDLKKLILSNKQLKKKVETK